MENHIKALILTILFWLSIFGVIGGFLNSIGGGCEYKSIASYFPTHYLMCELFRERF